MEDKLNKLTPEKNYHSLHSFFHDHPLPKKFDPASLEKIYWDLYSVNDADLPNLEQRRARSNLLVKIGIDAGVIKLNRGVYNESN